MDKFLVMWVIINIILNLRAMLNCCIPMKIIMKKVRYNIAKKIIIMITLFILSYLHNNKVVLMLRQLLGKLKNYLF